MGVFRSELMEGEGKKKRKGKGKGGRRKERERKEGRGCRIMVMEGLSEIMEEEQGWRKEKGRLVVGLNFLVFRFLFKI